MNNSPAHPLPALLLRVLALSTLAAFTGCVTVQDLDRLERTYPMRPNFQLKTGLEKSIDALPREKLVGTWETEYGDWEGLWRTNGGPKTFPGTLKMVFDFRDDGTCTVKTFKDGRQTSTANTSWSYKIQSKGVGRLDLPNLKLDARSVFWYSDDKMVLSYLNNDSAIAWRKKLLADLYDQSWWWAIDYSRDANLNVTVRSSHINPGSTIGHRRVAVEQANVYHRISGPAPKPSPTPAPQPVTPAPTSTPTVAAEYDIVSCEREANNDFAYRFELELKGAKSLKAFRAVQQEFRAALKEDYLESFAGADAKALFVEFPEYRQNGNRIEGRAVVLTVSVARLEYDPATRQGVLAVKIGANQFEDARKWIRKNIETLARDKNIALVTGEIPPAAKFYLGRETLKDGNVLEIEFKTE